MKLKLGFNKLLFALFSLFILSCVNKNEKDLKYIFDEQLKEIGEEKMSLFKSAKIDSSCEILQIITSEINSVYKEIVKNNKLNNLLDSIPFLTDSTNKKIYLTISFHEYLNGRNLLSSEIEGKFEKARNYYEDKVILLNAIENEKIATKNFESINIGDSLSLIFPVDSNYGHPHTFFKGGYPYSNDYSQADDSLNLLVILANKFQGEKTGLSPINKNGLYFKVKIISVSDTNVEIRTGSKVGNEFSFCLQYYGRVIKHW